MRRKLRAVLLLVVLACLFGCLAAAADQPTIICAKEVSSFIEQMHFGDRLAGGSKILASRGDIADWSDAIAGQGKAIDEGGGIQILKIFAIPFKDAAGAYRAAIIGGVIQSEDGAQIHEFITTTDIAGSAEIGGAIIAHQIGKIPDSDIDIKPLLGSIVAGSRSEIWGYILGNIAARTDSGISIRAAFESNGFACTTPPIWFPQKGIWYTATCIRRDQ